MSGGLRHALARATGHDAAVLADLPEPAVQQLGLGALAALVACALSGAGVACAAWWNTGSAGVAAGLGAWALLFSGSVTRLSIAGSGIPLGTAESELAAWRPGLGPWVTSVASTALLSSPLWLVQLGAGPDASLAARIAAVSASPGVMAVRAGLWLAWLAVLGGLRRWLRTGLIAYETERWRRARAQVLEHHAQCRACVERQRASEATVRAGTQRRAGPAFEDPPFNTRPRPYLGFLDGAIDEGASAQDAFEHARRRPAAP